MGNALPGLLATIAVIALVGNIFVVILFIKNRKWLKKAHSCLILALATQDILTSIGLLALPSFVQPPDAYVVPSEPTLRKVYCSLVWSQYFPFSLGVASVYTCLMLTIERWFAVVRPLAYRRLAQSPKLIQAIVVVPWLAGFTLEINGSLSGKPRATGNGSYECYWQTIEVSSRSVSLAIFTLFGTILVPSILMMVAYVQIIICIKRSSSRVGRSVSPEQAPGTGGGATTRGESHEFRSLKRVTRMVFSASAIMIACWLPDQVYYALSQMGLVELGTTAHHVFKVLAFANSCFNPFVYCFSNKQYRAEFKAIFSFCFLKQEAGD